MTQTTADFANDPETGRWNDRPADPVALNPQFDWPRDPRAVLGWYPGAWLQIAALSLCLGLALVFYLALLPPLQTMQSFAPGWMARVWAMSLFALALAAGALHWWLHRRVRAVHHRNVNTGPWSDISNHWHRNLLYFSTDFVHMIVPSHPLHLMFHAMFQQVSPVLSHSGFERVVVRDCEVAKTWDFFHQLHHRYFECNCGTSEIPFDKWFGTFHDGPADATARTRAYKRQMYRR